MTTANADATGVTTLRLAAAVLFGDAFAEQAPEPLLRAFRASPERWTDLMRSIWAFADRSAQNAPDSTMISYGSSTTAPERPAVANASTVVRDNVPAAPQAPPAPPATVPGVAWFEAQTAPTAGDQRATTSRSINAPTMPTAYRADPVRAPAPASAVVFDPTADQIELDLPKSRDELRSRLVDLLAEASGYPADVFEDNLDLEVDLGIDSVKQAQTLGKVRADSGLELEETFQMRDYQTVGKITDYLAGRLGL